MGRRGWESSELNHLHLHLHICVMTLFLFFKPVKSRVKEITSVELFIGMLRLIWPDSYAPIFFLYARSHSLCPWLNIHL